MPLNCQQQKIRFALAYLPIGPGAPLPGEEAPPRTPLPLGRVVLITHLDDHVLVALVLLRGFLLEHLGHLFL